MLMRVFTSPLRLGRIGCGICYSAGRQAALGVEDRAEGSIFLYEFGSLVDAEMVQVEQGADGLGASVEGDPERFPQNTPYLHEDAEGLLYLNAKLAKMEAERTELGTQTFSRVARQQLVAEGVCRIPEDVVAVTQLVDGSRHLGSRVRRPVVGWPWFFARHAQKSALRAVAIA